MGGGKRLQVVDVRIVS